jgi:hypothetical protein
MPWRLCFGVGEVKAEAAGVPAQPPECRGAPEAFLQIGFARSADIDRPTGVVLAVAWRRDEPEDLADPLGLLPAYAG